MDTSKLFYRWTGKNRKFKKQKQILNEKNATSVKCHKYIFKFLNK